ncbi:hypothetical protein LIA77_05488 [Sarocladium implicatum]|nr:hypothetical protein LIA77_05488 [Sarocladium implicatum]
MDGDRQFESGGGQVPRRRFVEAAQLTGKLHEEAGARNSERIVRREEKRSEGQERVKSRNAVRDREEEEEKTVAGQVRTTGREGKSRFEKGTSSNLPPVCSRYRDTQAKARDAKKAVHKVKMHPAPAQLSVSTTKPIFKSKRHRKRRPSERHWGRLGSMELRQGSSHSRQCPLQGAKLLQFSTTASGLRGLAGRLWPSLGGCQCLTSDDQGRHCRPVAGPWSTAVLLMRALKPQMRLLEAAMMQFGVAPGAVR